MSQIPDCYQRKIEIDRICAEPVVQIGNIKLRRSIRRECQVFLLGPAGGGTIGGGSPIALAA